MSDPGDCGDHGTLVAGDHERRSDVDGSRAVGSEGMDACSACSRDTPPSVDVLLLRDGSPRALGLRVVALPAPELGACNCSWISWPIRTCCSERAKRAVSLGGYYEDFAFLEVDDRVNVPYLQNRKGPVCMVVPCGALSRNHKPVL